MHITNVQPPIIEGPMLTESTPPPEATSHPQEKIIISAQPEPETSGEKIAKRQTVIYETRIEPNVIETIGEKLKTYLFMRFGFIKPRFEDIQLLSIDKFYEPYVKISGKYAIDYYRKTTYTIGVSKKVEEVIISDDTYRPAPPTDQFVENWNIVNLEAEERLKTEISASLVLDKFGQEVATREFPTNSFESKSNEMLADLGVKEVPQDTDLDMIRSRILKRPKDVHRVVSEIFEINERFVVYSPRYRLLYTNVRTGEAKAMEFDGITAQRIQHPSPLRSRPTEMR